MEKGSEIGVHEVEGNSVSNNDMPEISEDQKYLCDNVVISIEKMLNQLHPINGDCSCSIYRVPTQLREMNPKAYTPQLISIGPFHHQSQKDFEATEQYKLQALINFLGRINYNDKIMKEECSLENLLKTGTLKFLVEKAHCWMKEARNWYSEPINMNDHNFVIMMLMDGCFIVDFFIQKSHADYPDCHIFPKIQDNVDFSLLSPETAEYITYDLIKLENQVPFFLLQNLFNLIVEDSGTTSFMVYAYVALRLGFIQKYEIPFDYRSEELPKHLVDFIRLFFLPLPSNHGMQNINENTDNYLISFFRIPLRRLWNKKPHEKEYLIAPTITQLCEAGVTIKKAENVEFVMNITFKNGVLEIPPLHIYDEFELLVRNMVAFEQLSAGKMNQYVIPYLYFMDDLISTEKDVRLLLEAGVIINHIGGSDKEVSDLFNNFCKFITISKSTHFDSITKDLLEHCNGWWNKVKASLKHINSNTSWPGISVFATIFMILLTLVQIIFSGTSTF